MACQITAITGQGSLYIIYISVEYSNGYTVNMKKKVNRSMQRGI